tara:strand:+ start:7012 stop:7176 length:165 start_codon:yes stop_codon:yes gene_type:complete
MPSTTPKTKLINQLKNEIKIVSLILISAIEIISLLILGVKAEVKNSKNKEMPPV